MNTTKITKSEGEFRVRLFINGVYQAGADYFTDDKTDAKNTALIMERDGVESDKTTDFAKDEQADFDEENEAETRGDFFAANRSDFNDFRFG